MNIEKERKFLLRELPEELKGLGTYIKQTYLMLEDKKQLRVRIARSLTKEEAWIAYKESIDSETKLEYEYDIPYIHGLKLTRTNNPSIEKTRYKTTFIDDKGTKFKVDIDIYPSGLGVVEIEFKEGQVINSLPPYCGADVTDERQLSNVYMAKHGEVSAEEINGVVLIGEDIRGKD